MGSVDQGKGKGGIKLLPAEHSDMQEILEMHLLAFRNPLEPFINVLYPLDEPIEQAAKRALDSWVGNPSSTYMKVVDEETGKIISAAKWTITKEQLTEEQMNKHITVDWCADPEANAYGEHCINWLVQNSMDRTKGKPSIILNILSTHPDHQGRGAGGLIMKWGTELADYLGYEAFIEASGYGRHLYETWGFVATPDEWVVIPVPDKWREKVELKCYWMERSPRKI
ncbi:hypothetical protein B7463_g6520, partial [Scytalidium lignicola]